MARNLPQFETHHKSYFLALAEFIRGFPKNAKITGGSKMFEGKANLEDFLMMIRNEHSGNYAASLEEVPIEKINSQSHVA